MKIPFVSRARFEELHRFLGSSIERLTLELSAAKERERLARHALGVTDDKEAEELLWAAGIAQRTIFTVEQVRQALRFYYGDRGAAERVVEACCDLGFIPDFPSLARVMVGSAAPADDTDQCENCDARIPFELTVWAGDDVPLCPKCAADLAQGPKS